MFVKIRIIIVCFLEFGEMLEDFVNDVVSCFVGCDFVDWSESFM